VEKKQRRTTEQQEEDTTTAADDKWIHSAAKKSLRTDIILGKLAVQKSGIVINVLTNGPTESDAEIKSLMKLYSTRSWDKFWEFTK
jgi:hypothetical protein